jgi:hypothetical protein
MNGGGLLRLERRRRSIKGGAMFLRSYQLWDPNRELFRPDMAGFSKSDFGQMH